MSKETRIKIPRGILGQQSGTTSPIQISKNGVITISKENRIITKKIISKKTKN